MDKTITVFVVTCPNSKESKYFVSYPQAIEHWDKLLDQGYHNVDIYEYEGDAETLEPVNQ